MLHLDHDNVYRSALLAQIPGMRHGFGTRLSSNWLSGERVSSLRQIHSDIVMAAANPGVIGDGDALVTDQSGLFVSIRTADCVPILLADPERHIVAAIHAGWRGTAATIVRRVVNAMAREFGSDPHCVVAAIGPAIGPCCYEVGPEVASQFGTFFPEWDNAPQRVKLDLVETNRRQLLTAGISAGNIDTAGVCTACEISLLESYRRDREASGRMVAAISN